MSSPGTIADLNASPNARPDADDSPRAEYQFTTAQVRLMDGLGREMRVVANVGMVAGVLMLLAVSTELAVHGPARFGALSLTPIVFLLVAAWTRSAGREFHAVAANPNREITHLIAALEYQERVFRFAVWVLGILAALLLMGIIVTLAGVGGAGT